VPPRRRAGARAVGAGALAAALVLSAGACGDDQPAFCGDLEAAADLQELSDALSGGDLTVARAEARRLDDLAGRAPSEVRPDLLALTGAVVDVVELLDGGEPGGTGAEALNRRLAELDRRSTAVEDWALRTCGLQLR
jgi:hypothetical protein